MKKIACTGSQEKIEFSAGLLAYWLRKNIHINVFSLGCSSKYTVFLGRHETRK